MDRKHALDMTKGKPLPLLIQFAIPLVFGALFQQLYSFTDTAIVGRCIGADALTAVGITNPLNQLVLGFAMGSAVGFCIPISQMVGADKPEEASRYFWNGLYLCVILGLAVSCAVFFFVGPLLRLMKTPAELLEMAVSYLTVIVAGQIVTVLYNYLSGVLRAFGDSKRPFWFLVISSCLNVALDLLLILVIPMGVAGAAVATVISQIVSVLLCAWWLAKKMRVIRTRDSEGLPLTKLSGIHLKDICVMGMPLGIAHSACYIGNVVLQSSINTLGTVAAAAQICGERIRTIATLPMESVGMAMATYAGQNFGAKRMDRIHAGIRAGMTIQIAYCIIAWILLFLLKKPLVFLLLGQTTSPEAITAIQYLTIISPLFILHGSMQIFRNAVQGMGFGVCAIASATMEVIGRSAAGLLALHFGSFFLIGLSAPMAWALAVLCCVILYSYFSKTAVGQRRCP